MKMSLKNFVLSLLAVILVFSLTIPCFAATNNGSITITLEDKDKKQINDVSVHLCRIAELNSTGYFPVVDFENSGISISSIINNPDEIAAKSVADYIEKNNVKGVSGVSENGKVTFSDLPLGIWIVYCDKDGKYTFNPFIVLLPYESGGKLYFEISSVPKVEDSKPNEINIYLLKKWDDKNNASKNRPESVTIELLDGDSVVQSVVLSEENGWSHTFKAMSKNGNYSVRETKVKDYKAAYSGDTINGFLVTNTYVGEKLPQTGQYWWPILLIAVAGVGLVLLGVYELGVKKNGKEK